MADYFCIVDKSGGESHSFVDGMLLGELRAHAPVRVCYARGSGTPRDPLVQLVAPIRRKGFGRLLYPAWCLYQFLGSRRKARVENVVFIRNEVVALLAFAALKRLWPGKFTLFFQSSFPHEEFNAPRLLKSVIKHALTWSIAACSRVYVVNEGAIPRMKAHGVNCRVHVIPLCCDFRPAVRGARLLEGPLRFIYIGSYDRHRDLGEVLQAFDQLARAGRDFRVTFYGGSVQDLQKSCPEAASVIDRLIELGILHVGGRVSRAQIPALLASADVGLNLIPPKPMYLESSSTKLGEYLSQGLTVVSSRGISYHEQMHGRYDIGHLAEFEVHSMVRVFERILSEGRAAIQAREDACLRSFKDDLQYSAYVDLLLFPPESVTDQLPQATNVEFH